MEFIEQRIITAIRELLTGKVNEYLRDFDFQIPFVEFGVFRGVDIITPLITFSSCEQTEKERIVKQDSYFVTVTFPVLDTVESELYCFAYADVFYKALGDDVALGGAVDRAVITNKYPQSRALLPRRYPDFCVNRFSIFPYFLKSLVFSNFTATDVRNFV